jgi:hypothetical protein
VLGDVRFDDGAGVGVHAVAEQGAHLVLGDLAAVQAEQRSAAA